MYWDHTYEDMMNLLARLPEVCALIYRCTYHDGVVPAYDKSLDYSGNFCQVQAPSPNPKPQPHPGPTPQPQAHLAP